MEATPQIKKDEKGESLVIIFFILVYFVVLVRTAWISDDAYISFRTIDNFINGYGLTFNIGERVQSFTNPLWVLILAFFYSFTNEIFNTSLLISMIISLVAVSLYAFKLSKTPLVSVFGVTVLMLSKAFIDYSTSGLENPMNHLLIVLFFSIYFITKKNIQKWFFLTLIASLCMVNRMDTILLFLPALTFYFFEGLRSHFNIKFFIKKAVIGLLGFIPFMVWELFSLVYYGFPFPNTAYAKLNTGISSIEYILQGVFYFFNSMDVDPITPFIIIIGICFPFIIRDKRLYPVSIGVIFYVIYTIKVGGDFMSGRFLAAPLLCSVIALSFLQISLHRYQFVFILSIVVLLGFVSPYPTLLSNSKYGLDRSFKELVDHRGIADERGVYYPHSGFLRQSRTNEMPNFRTISTALEDRASGKKVTVVRMLGFYSFFVGPHVHVIDQLALSDPLLARLPMDKSKKWRIGHFNRTIPDGYIETIEKGEILIKDPDVAAYYEKLSMVIRGEILDTSRFKEIWNFNTGKYNSLVLPK
ncbi:glycosyltransferase family 39 protein [Ammoniphilus sp. 3BR4]|uniref:glycosyltransferase family 39 protein n=1 Tax=Ammoniphilus sp. 3BR4 TaxID=3158265 RepID=UPI0034678A0D